MGVTACLLFFVCKKIMKGGCTMVFGKSFTYNNKNSLTDFNLLMVDFDGSGKFEEPDTAQSLELITERIGNNPRHSLINVRYEDTLSFKIGVCKSVCDNNSLEFTKDEVRNIHRWLTSDRYSKLTIDNKKYENIFFNAVPINITPEIISDKIIGFVIEWKCDSPYGYETVSNVYTVDGNETVISFNNTTDDLLNSGIIRPHIKVLKKGTGEWHLANQTTDKVMSFSQLLNDETLIIDCENYVLTSDVSNHNLYQYFNRVWTEFAAGSNLLKISGNCTVSITCDIPRKAGI